jgi:hypothetical protein
MYNFQGVHETFQVAVNPTLPSIASVKEPRSELVFIGRKLDRLAIKQVRAFSRPPSCCFFFGFIDR